MVLDAAAQAAGSNAPTAAMASPASAIRVVAGLLTTERRGRYVHYSADLPALTTLGADLLAAMLR